ncbi:MAG: ornithine decarboxylase, partial [Pseudomonadota bacterium]
MTAIGDYYSAVQLRSDRWSHIKQLAAERAAGVPAKRAAALDKKLIAQFEVLEPIESYWAFPGLAAFNFMRRQLQLGHYDDLAVSVRRVVRALSTGAYRRRRITLAADDHDLEDVEDEQTQPLEARALARPYFETLIVDRVTDQQADWLKASLHRMRRQEDSFVYEPVIVPTLEDALIGILFNHNIQAVVVRSGLGRKSEHDLPILKKYLSRIGDEDTDALAEEDMAPELCRLIHKVRPELDVYLVTDRSVEEIAGRDLGGCKRVFYNQEDFQELHLNLLRGVNNRYKTP